MKPFELFLMLTFTLSVCIEAKKLRVTQRIQTLTYDDFVISFLDLSNIASYNPKVRPFTLVDIDIGISYRQLVSLDEKLGIMTSSFYLTLQWNDYRLQWDSTDPDLGNLTEIVLPATIVRKHYFLFNLFYLYNYYFTNLALATRYSCYKYSWNKCLY